jgi:hypothetical protein
MDQGWNAFAVQVFLGLVLLPVALAFSVRTLPLYLRLAVPDWPVRGSRTGGSSPRGGSGSEGSRQDTI